MLAILDFGSQYSELIARRIRETEVYSEVLSYRTSAEQLRQLNPKGIILSGGPNSVYDPGAPACDPEIWNLGIPILGVCYGMQLMVQQLGGQVERAERGEYGKAALLIDQPTELLAEVTDASTMWMSHGDSVTRLPEGFEILAHTENTPQAAIADPQKQLLRRSVSSRSGAFHRGLRPDPQLRLSHLPVQTHLDNRSLCRRSHSRSARQSWRPASVARAVGWSRFIYAGLFAAPGNWRSAHLYVYRPRLHAQTRARTPNRSF